MPNFDHPPNHSPNPVTLEDVRSLWDMCRGIVESVHSHDRAIAVLATRMDGADARIDGTNERVARSEEDIRSIRLMTQQILDRLTAHMTQEDKDRKSLLMWVISTLLTVVGAGGSALWMMIHQRLM